MEHNVIGKIFAYGQGENTGIIKGNAAIFVVEIDTVYEAPELNNYTSYINQKLMEFNQRVTGSFPYKALELSADIKDYRRYFY
jgi:hypothetical protein